MLYGSPDYYHRFGFINAKNYQLTTPDNTNFEEFMALELYPDSLKSVSGRCLETTAFEIDKDELKEYDAQFTSDKLHQLDYTAIKAEFEKADKQFPLSEEECTGLTDEEKQEITPCGTYCGTGEDYGVICDGCRNRKGRPIWYDLYDKKEPCIHYTCALSNGIYDCSDCSKLLCEHHFTFPDPNMPDDIKQYWLELRMNNFKKVNPNLAIELEESYEKNVEKFLK